MPFFLSGRVRLAFLLVLCAAFFAAGCQSRPAGQDAKKKTAYDIYREYAKDFPGVKDIAPESLMTLTDPVIIDTRSQKERAVSMIKNAVSEEDFLKAPDSYAGRPLVAYCTIGYRSGEFAEKMAKRGLAVKNLKAGILGWLHAGGEITGPDGESSKTVDVYGDDWDLAPDGIKTVW